MNTFKSALVPLLMAIMLAGCGGIRQSIGQPGAHVGTELTEALLAKGAQHFARGEYSEVIAICDEVIAHDAEAVAAYYNRGSAYARSGKYAHALLDFSKAIELQPKYANAYASRGETLRRMGEPLRAVADLSTALAYRPDYVEVLNWRGIAYQELGRSDLAIVDFTKAIKLRPEFSNALLNRASAYGRSGNAEAGMADIVRLLENKLGDPSALYFKGLFLYNSGRYAEAVACLNTTLAAASERADAYVIRGAAHLRLGNTELAIRDYKTAVRLDPKGSHGKAAAAYLKSLPTQ